MTFWEGFWLALLWEAVVFVHRLRKGADSVVLGVAPNEAVTLVIWW